MPAMAKSRPFGCQSPAEWDELEALEVRVDRVVREAALHFSGACVGPEHLDGEEVALRHVDHVEAVGTQRRAKVKLPLVGRLVDDAAPVVVRGAGLLTRVREIGLEFVLPAIRKLSDRHFENGFDRRQRIPRARGEVENPADPVVPERAADVGPESVAVPVREVPPVSEFRNRREPFFQVQRVPHPHRRERVDGSDREVFGHPLDEPQREPDGAGHVQPRASRPLPRHVELEGVHEFVAEQVIGLVERHHHRHDEPPLQDLREALRALVDELAGGVRLLEIRMVRVEDDRLALAELVIEHPRQAGVPALGEAADHLRAGRTLLVVVDVEVLRLEHLEVERLVNHLVSAEIPAGLPLQRGSGGTREGRESGKRDERVSSPKHTTSTRRPLLSTFPGSWTPGGRAASRTASSQGMPKATRGTRPSLLRSVSAIRVDTSTTEARARSRGRRRYESPERISSGA